jgi:hypothetical protein
MSSESQEQAGMRLLKVIANAEYQVLAGFYAFEAMPNGPAETRPAALVCVRDGKFWSQLIPVARPDAVKDSFKIFAFRFSPRFDATGFVGWLHSHLARTAGAASIVICGKDRRTGRSFGHGCGNIFDYWGCPADHVGAVLAEVKSLIERGRIVGAFELGQVTPMDIADWIAERYELTHRLGNWAARGLEPALEALRQSGRMAPGSRSVGLRLAMERR